MEVKVHSSVLKLVASGVVWWLTVKAVQLGVMVQGAEVKWCDGDMDTSKEREWGDLIGLMGRWTGKRKTEVIT